MLIVVLGVAWRLDKSDKPLRLQTTSLPDTASQDRKTLGDSPEIVTPASVDRNLPDVAESESARQQREYASFVSAVVEELLRRGDGPSLAVAGRLMYANGGYFGRSAGQNLVAYRQNTIDQFKRAAELSPRDPVIQRMALWACMEMFLVVEAHAYGCDPNAYETALRASDPANASVWLSDIRNALDQKNEALKEQALVAMARSTAFQDYGAAETALVTKVVQSVRVSPPATPQGELQPVNRLLLKWPPRQPRSVKPLIEACERDGGAQQIGLCHQVAKLMLDKGAVSYAISALKIEEQLALPGSARAQEVADAQRRLSWQMQQAPLVGRIRGKAPSYWEANDTVAQMERLLRENGVSLDPPDEWVQ
ncbi:MAG TPA: hypothetical protein VK629_12210 [Steroidobacteraceae bacterium]|nr:hypothetical protein [Steroidobacteraceae bacterium]